MAALRRAGRRDLDAKTEAIQQILHQPGLVQRAYVAIEIADPPNQPGTVLRSVSSAVLVLAQAQFGSPVQLSTESVPRPGG